MVAWSKNQENLGVSEHLECLAPCILRFKTQFTAGRAVHLGLLGSAVLSGL